MTLPNCKLDRSGDFRSLSIKDYLSTLLDEIVAIFPKKYELSITNRIVDIPLSAKLTSSIGIIINELATNSMKYAIPDTVTVENSTGFGMQTIKVLVEQINGSIRIERAGGTKYLIDFAT